MNNVRDSVDKLAAACPVPKSEYDRILLAHGGGGLLSHDLINKIFISQFDNELLNQQHDGAVFEQDGIHYAFTTDSYVVQPVFFPGGDIGCLAINGTVNDLAMCGARPLYVSAGFILEEGFCVDDLLKIARSMKTAAEIAGVEIVTGDTKVVERGKGDKIYINTSGIGVVAMGVNISPRNCCPGDAIILSGSIAEHGIAVLSAREGLEFGTTIKSDTVALNDLVAEVLNISRNIHVLRDPTRGGVASSLNEIAQTAKLGIEIEESRIPVKEEVKAACELLGLDSLYVANEGKAIVFVSAEDAGKVLSGMRSHKLGAEAQIIGRVVDAHPGIVVMKNAIGTSRIIDMLSGNLLPRIC